MDASSTKHRLPLVLSIAATASLVLAACGSTTAAPVTETGVRGGTLTLLGSGDVDHLDTASAYYTTSYIIERAYTRQLFSYPTSADQATAASIVADIATQVPTKSNGGISSDGLTYTVKIKSGVKWNTSPARQVTAQDELLGMKRLCNPVQPVGAPSYYESTIVGFMDYCEPMLKIAGTASAIAAYINSHDISGITTQGSDTVVFKLTQPASDFVNILALPFASPAPQEYLQYIPDDAGTFQQHTISDGPYAITSYDPGKSIILDRNPAWDASTDSVRKAYVDHIKVTEGLDQNGVQQQIAAGTGDMQWDEVTPTADLAQLLQSKDPRLVIGPSGLLNPYIVFNFQSPNAAVKNLKVRQAIEYAIDKVAIAQFYGGISINKPVGQVMTPGNAGYQQFDLYPTPDNKGDPAKAKSLLADAGYPNGLTLHMVYRTSGNHPKNAQSYQADLAKIGITLKLQPVPPADFYTKYLENASASKRGVWDIADPGWQPDWYGNNGRTMISPLFDGRTYGPGTTDYGDYNSDAVNSDIDQALKAAPADAGKFWHMADMQIMQDAAIVPVLDQQAPVFHSSRLQNFIYFPFSTNGDVTNLWIKA